MLLCVEKQDAANAKKVFKAVHTRWPIGHGNLRKNYYYLLYQVEDHEEIIKGFNSIKSGSAVDEENSLYIATLYKIGKSKFGFLPSLNTQFCIRRPLCTYYIQI